MSELLFDKDGRAIKGRRVEVLTTEMGYLWANLLNRGFLNNQKTLGFCAIEADEGAAAMALNLALFLGSKGRRVALLEADLRKPLTAKLFKLSESPGLAEFLTGQASFVDVVRPQVAEGVDLIPAGRSDDPFWSFTGGNFSKVVERVSSTYDVCFVAVPPLNRAPEATLVVRTLDASLLVVGANRHRSDAISQQAAGLRALGTPFLGAILNEMVHDVPPIIAKLT